MLHFLRSYNLVSASIQTDNMTVLIKAGLIEAQNLNHTQMKFTIAAIVKLFN